MYESFKEQGATITTKQGKYEGQKAQIQDIVLSSVGQNSDETHKIIIYISTSTKLLLGAEVSGIDGTGKTIMEGDITFDYPDDGPKSIYDLGVPRDTKIAGAEKSLIEQIVAKIDSRKNWPEPRGLVTAYWQARAKKDFEEMAIMWPGSEEWNEKLLKDEKAVEYVFGDVQEAEIEKHIIVPYATKSYYEQHKSYNLKMQLSNKKSSVGRYYIVSGN